MLWHSEYLLFVLIAFSDRLWQRIITKRGEMYKALADLINMINSLANELHVKVLVCIVT